MCIYLFFNIRTSKVASVGWAGPALLLSLWRGRSRSRSKAGSWGECGAEEIVTLRPSPGRIFVQFPVLTARAFPLLTPLLLYATEKLLAAATKVHSYFSTIKNSSKTRRAFLWSPRPGWRTFSSSGSPESSATLILCHPEWSWHQQLTLASILSPDHSLAPSSLYI